MCARTIPVPGLGFKSKVGVPASSRSRVYCVASRPMSSSIQAIGRVPMNVRIAGSFQVHPP